MFKQYGFEVIKNCISKELSQALSIQFDMLRDNKFLENNIPLDSVGFSSGSFVKESFSWYSPYCFESLLVMLQNKIENVTGVKLYPCYSMGRIYYKGAVLPKHVDRPSCEYSTSITISTDGTPWDIWIEDANGMQHAVTLDVGDMIVYRGDLLTHWREEYTGNKHTQAFLHYVDTTGMFSSFKYDRRKMLGSTTAMTSHEAGGNW
jgi:hypothetical protein